MGCVGNGRLKGAVVGSLGQCQIEFEGQRWQSFEFLIDGAGFHGRYEAIVMKVGRAVVDMLLLEGDFTAAVVQEATALKVVDKEESLIDLVGDDTSFRLGRHRVSWEMGCVSCDDLSGRNDLTQRKSLGCEVIEGLCFVMDRSGNGGDVQDTNGLVAFAEGDGREGALGWARRGGVELGGFGGSQHRVEVSCGGVGAM